jgi:hypothetical protein
VKGFGNYLVDWYDDKHLQTYFEIKFGQFSIWKCNQHVWIADLGVVDWMFNG